MGLKEELDTLARHARAYFDSNGRYPGEPLPRGENLLDERQASKLKRQVEDCASEDQLDCYMMTIENRHMGNPKLFDHLTYPPSSRMWPHDEMLTGLKGRAQMVRDWARANGLTVTISFDSSYNPTLRTNRHFYSLVVSWPKDQKSEAA